MHHFYQTYGVLGRIKLKILMAEKILIFLILLYCWRSDSFASRQKRQTVYSPPIVYPFGGTFKNSADHQIKVSGKTHDSHKCTIVFQSILSIFRRSSIFTETFRSIVRCELLILFAIFFFIMPTFRFVVTYYISQLIVGLAVPVQLSGRILVYGQNLQFQYALPPNATAFTDFFEKASLSRRRRESVSWNERMTVYKLLEEEFERRGINGKECMKKSICEAAIAPLKDEGLVGELLHLLFTPQRDVTLLVDSEYSQALKFGQENHDCSEIYRACLPGQGILDQISEIIL